MTIAVRLKQPWKIWPIGHVIAAMPGNVARGLIARGIVEDMQQPAAESASALKAPADRMLRPSQMRLKSR